MQEALDNAEISPAEIDSINAHATSTKKGDAAETWGIRKVFGERAEAIPICGLKGFFGHTLGCAGALESIMAIKSLQTGILPGTPNQTTPDPECDLDYVPEGPRQTNPKHILKNAFGFGPTNASLVFGKV
jgi:3-oxoacyl-[acyl-carrier-protein] synthase II